MPPPAEPEAEVIDARPQDLSEPAHPTPPPGFPPPSLEAGWHLLFTGAQRQDALWYLRLATTGWSPADGSAAFFPLYPLLVRAVSWVPGVGPLGAALLVANGAFLGGLVAFHALTRLEFGGVVWAYTSTGLLTRSEMTPRRLYSPCGTRLVETVNSFGP